jgi:predicted RNA-binding protein with PUA-like domain
MRDEMQVGDMGFFYHSNTKPPGIVGLMKVVSRGYPDPTQFDPDSEYFDPKATRENPRWYVVDVEFVEKAPRQLSLSEIKEDPVLATMEVAKKGQMLSITKVTKEQWDRARELLGDLAKVR